MIDIQDETLSPSQSEDKYEAVINIIHNFLEYYEKWTWEVKGPLIKNAFKAAKLCESIYTELAQGDCLLHFDIYISHWLASRFPDSITKKYDIHFFRKSCDILLEKFLRSEKKLSNDIVRKAIVIYISLCSEERCSSLIDEMMADSVLFRSVCDIKDLMNCKSETCQENVAIDALHQHLSQLADQHNIDNFKVAINNSIIHRTINSYLDTYFGNIAAINSKDETKDLLLNTLLENLQETADLRLRFWKANSQSELDLFARIANNYPDFLSAMLDLIRVEGHSMTMSFDDRFQLTWRSTDSSFTYNEVVALIKCLINTKGNAGNKTKRFLLSNAGSDEDDTSFWSHVVYLLGLQT